jgi:hypothetical protein
MAKFNFLKRLITEDFNEDDQELIGKVASILNPAFEAITNALNNNLTLADNFNAQVKEITFIMGTSGVPSTELSFKSTLKGSCRAMIVSRVDNLTNSATYPAGGVFPSFSQSGDIITIKHITGLVSGSKYTIRVELAA